MDALLSADKDMTMELWMMPSQIDKVAEGYSDVIEKYRKRIVICPKEVSTETLFFPKKPIRGIKSVVYRIIAGAFFFNKKISKYWSDKSALNRSIYIDSRVSLAHIFNRWSHADAAYVPFIESVGALGLDKPVFMQIHDLYRCILLDFFEKEDDRVNYRKWVRDTEKSLNKYALEGACFVTSNGFVKEAILKYTDADWDHCRVIHYPAMLKLERNDRVQSEAEIRKKYAIGESPYVFFPSQNRPNKNLIVLIKALKRLEEKGRDLKLVTTGRMSDVKSTERYVKCSPGLVKEIGQVPAEDIYPLYKCSAMVVCPNIIEGPLISEQAMGALKVGGIPVAHARSMGYDTWLSESGLSEETAELNRFDTDDDETLSFIMEDMLENPEKHVAKQANVAEVFERRSWKETAEEFLKLFREAAR